MVKPLFAARPDFMPGGLAFRGDSGNHGGMPTYPVHIAFEHDDPMPPFEQLQSIEADDPHAALELLSRQKIYAEAGTESAWLRVIVDYHPDGAALRSISLQINLVPVARDN